MYVCVCVCACVCVCVCVCVWVGGCVSAHLRPSQRAGRLGEETLTDQPL